MLNCSFEERQTSVFEKILVDYSLRLDVTRLAEFTVPNLIVEVILKVIKLGLLVQSVIGVFVNCFRQQFRSKFKRLIREIKLS